jgi:hypothetical protein
MLLRIKILVGRRLLALGLRLSEVAPGRIDLRVGPQERSLNYWKGWLPE